MITVAFVVGVLVVCLLVDRVGMTWSPVTATVLGKETLDLPCPNAGVGLEEDPYTPSPRTPVRLYSVRIRLPTGTNHWLNVPPEVYELLTEGEQVRVELQLGRFTCVKRLRNLTTPRVLPSVPAALSHSA